MWATDWGRQSSPERGHPPRVWQSRLRRLVWGGWRRVCWEDSRAVGEGNPPGLRRGGYLDGCPSVAAWDPGGFPLGCGGRFSRNGVRLADRPRRAVVSGSSIGRVASLVLGGFPAGRGGQFSRVASRRLFGRLSKCCGVGSGRISARLWRAILPEWGEVGGSAAPGGRIGQLAGEGGVACLGRSPGRFGRAGVGGYSRFAGAAHTARFSKPAIRPTTQE
jgi:hypothetical protein